MGKAEAKLFAREIAHAVLQLASSKGITDESDARGWPGEQGQKAQMSAAFVSELIRAANRVPKLTKFERARLFERAAAAIEDFRCQ